MQKIERKPLFDLGQLVATPGALAALEKTGQSAMEFLSRHVRGEKNLDQQGIRSVSDLSSQVPGFTFRTTGNDKIWVITEADRSHTTLLLPDEY